MTDRKLCIRDVFDPTRMNSLIVSEDEMLVKTIKRFAEQPPLRGIFIADNDGKLKGVVTRTDLLNMIKFELGDDLGELPLRILLLKRIREVKTKDIAGEYSYRASVKLDDPVHKALELMTELDLVNIPVIDADDKIIGDLNLSEILLKTLEPSKD